MTDPTPDKRGPRKSLGPIKWSDEVLEAAARGETPLPEGYETLKTMPHDKLPTPDIEGVKARLEVAGVTPEQIEIIPNYCDGADDPEDRCPRHPSECICWQFPWRVRQGISVGDGRFWRQKLKAGLNDEALAVITHLEAERDAAHATGFKEGLERAAEIAEEEPIFEGSLPAIEAKRFANWALAALIQGAGNETAKSIANAIRAEGER